MKTDLQYPEDVDVVLTFVASLTPQQRDLLCQVASLQEVQWSDLSARQQATASGLQATDMHLLRRIVRLGVQETTTGKTIVSRQVLQITTLGEQVALCLMQEVDG
jgi:hypothetical protein